MAGDQDRGRGLPARPSSRSSATRQWADGDGGYNGVAIASRVGLEDVSRGFKDEPGSPDLEKARDRGDLRRRAGLVGLRSRTAARSTARTTSTKLAWLAGLRASKPGAEMQGGRPLAICGDFKRRPDPTKDVWDPQAFVGSTHVTPAERQAVSDLLALGPQRRSAARAGRAPRSPTGTTAPGCSTKEKALRIDLVLVSEALAAELEDAYIDRDARKGSKPSDQRADRRRPQTPLSDAPPCLRGRIPVIPICKRQGDHDDPREHPRPADQIPHRRPLGSRSRPSPPDEGGPRHRRRSGDRLGVLEAPLGNRGPRATRARAIAGARRDPGEGQGPRRPHSPARASSRSRARKPDTTGKLVAHAYSYEHMELAAYELLGRVAERAGDIDTVQAARQIAAQERNMGETARRPVRPALPTRRCARSGVRTSARQLEKYLADAHAIEAQALKLLENAPELAGNSTLAAAYDEHRSETEEHERLVTARLDALGRRPLAAEGRRAGARWRSTGARSSAPSRTRRPSSPRFAYAFEHLEIASYELPQTRRRPRRGRRGLRCSPRGSSAMERTPRRSAFTRCSSRRSTPRCNAQGLAVWSARRGAMA